MAPPMNLASAMLEPILCYPGRDQVSNPRVAYEFTTVQKRMEDGTGPELGPLREMIHDPQLESYKGYLLGTGYNGTLSKEYFEACGRGLNQTEMKEKIGPVIFWKRTGEEKESPWEEISGTRPRGAFKVGIAYNTFRIVHFGKSNHCLHKWLSHHGLYVLPIDEKIQVKH